MHATPHRIDVHHHILPDHWVKATGRFGHVEAGGIAYPEWSSERALAMMDRHGIATAITSIAAPGVHFGDAAAAKALARACNETSARLIDDHPNRFGAFAVLPMPDVDASLAEIDYALGTLELDGVVLLASIGERYLGDPAFDAVFDELNRRKAVVFVHPTVPVTSQALKLSMPGALIEFVFDTTRAATNLIYSGTMERCPNLSLILSHAGGTVPFVAWRLAQGAVIPALRDKAPQGAIAYLKRFYYDTAMSATPYALNSLLELVDTSHVLFGSDFPYLPEPQIEASVVGLQSYSGFDAGKRRAVECESARALFPRLQTIGAALAAG